MWPLNAKQLYEAMTGLVCKNKGFEKIIIEGISQDSRKIKPHQIFAAIKGDNFDGHDYLKRCLESQVQLALVQQNSLILNKLTSEEKSKCICVEDVTEALRKLAQFMRKNFTFPIVGIGGSNGKTTTKEILYSMLLGQNNNVTKTEKSENGYLGIPLTLLQSSHTTLNPPSCLVLEIGIDEIGAMQQHLETSSPDIVLLTALGPEHLAGLNNWETAAKEELILLSSPTSIKIWQLSDPKINEAYFHNLKINFHNIKNDYVVIEKKEYKIYKNHSIHYENLKSKTEIIWDIKKENASSSEIQIEINKFGAINNFSPLTFNLPLPGKHNSANFALALAAALSVGVSLEAIIEGFNKFIPPPMRSNVTLLPHNILLYNDAYNSSPLSLKAALCVLENPEWLQKQKLVVLGDMLDLGGESNYWHESLVSALSKLKMTHLCLYGSAMYSCYKLLQDLKQTLLQENGTQIYWLDSKEEPSNFFDKFDFELQNCVILVKGSRSMRLERFIKVLEEKCSSS